ncbi:MAG TPA: pyrroloquinoline quinone biosynthesis peptide chaperone PqqD [Chromatiales bacterium]|nr:pyrroloquinoline quinone biosynthesis peptide chaperone PqqD [Thiotrichales bacterium]HIP69530.1 pyrroloquinoline quinone biosynthesis peptide chaperone PqqD [Chromatiales bacterium]
MNSKPVLADGFRLNWDEDEQTYVLLYPEGMIVLDEENSEVLQRCSGTKTIADIISEMELIYPQLNTSYWVQEPLKHAVQNGWVVLI